MNATNTRYGKVHVKANRTDPIYQTLLVRDEGDGYLEYNHPQTGKWHILPDEWKDRIRWDGEASAE